MLNHPALFLVVLWFIIGLLCMGSVLSRMTQPLDRHRTVRNLFFLAIFLAGPLNFLVVFIPVSIVQSWADSGRDWLDARESKQRQLSEKDKARLISARNEAIRAQKALDERINKELAKIGGQ